MTYSDAPPSSEDQNDRNLLQERTLQDYIAIPLELVDSEEALIGWLNRQVESRQISRKPDPGNQRSTGLHPSIRATSTDGDRRLSPIPAHDDPQQENIPGENEVSPDTETGDDDYDEAYDQ